MPCKDEKSFTQFNTEIKRVLSSFVFDLPNKELIQKSIFQGKQRPSMGGHNICMIYQSLGINLGDKSYCRNYIYYSSELKQIFFLP